MVRIGIICPSEIALRRFLPSLLKLPDFLFVGLAHASAEEWEGANDVVLSREKEKAEEIVKLFGGRVFCGYNDLIHSNEIDAVYIPLPPALHYYWAKKSLNANKHVMVEKPSTTSFAHTKELIEIAKNKELAIHENYMFKFHSQIIEINNIVAQEILGDIRLYRISFGFPLRPLNDFRYNKKLGGGALLDCGGYTIKYASMLLGKTARIVHSKLNYLNGYDIDMYGSATLINEQGLTVQIAFGMDNSYKCELEIWGSKGCLTTGRVLTAPAGFAPEVTLKIGNNVETRTLPSDDAFQKSIVHFKGCIDNKLVREKNYSEIIEQSELIQHFISKQSSNVNE